ncbi:MAG: gliding motility protein GldL [Fermentimonas sp.]|jgi:hypothetical protein
MANYTNRNNKLEKFLQTSKGKRLLNFVYSIGAAIVILGAMFKILHLPFGNELLFIGMITEVIVFTISAFDTPLKEYNWERVFPSLTSDGDKQHKNIISDSLYEQMESKNISDNKPEEYKIEDNSISQKNPNIETQNDEYNKQMESLNRTLSGLNTLYEMQIKNVSSQINSLEHVNKSLSNLERVFGDNIHESNSIKVETERLAQQLKELNEIYARMIDAISNK